MPVFVSKFGGTSLANGENFQNAISIVHKDKNRRVIVCSAPGKRHAADTKVTDLIINAFKKRDPRIFDAIKDRFLEIADVLKADIRDDLIMSRDVILSGNDFMRAVSLGEYLSAKLFSIGAGYPFWDSKDAMYFENGEITGEKTKKALESALQKHGRFVLPGFYGSDERGNIFLFPRGGGDITGAVAAHFLNADIYENWTDVDGVYDKDPNLHPDARAYQTLTYDELEKILLSGANVLNPSCLFWARQSNTVIRIRNTFRPSSPGTLIIP